MDDGLLGLAPEGSRISGERGRRKEQGDNRIKCGQPGGGEGRVG